MGYLTCEMSCVSLLLCNLQQLTHERQARSDSSSGSQHAGGTKDKCPTKYRQRPKTYVRAGPQRKRGPALVGTACTDLARRKQNPAAWTATTPRQPFQNADKIKRHQQCITSTSGHLQLFKTIPKLIQRRPSFYISITNAYNGSFKIQVSSARHILILEYTGD